jgi:phytoene dehydrogenase-like protein
VQGVTLAGGETLDAGTVAASCDPKTLFLRLLGAADVPGRLQHRIEAYRCHGTAAKVDLTLSAPLRFRGRPDAAIARAFTGETLDDLERAFDAVKYRRTSARPVLDVLAGTDGRAVSIVAQFAPYAPEGGWTEDARERLGDAVVGELERVAPGTSAAVTARRVLAPPDVERVWGVTGGHLHHGDHGLDQLFVRPSPECARHATPVPGLFLCGSGSHPGGGLTGAPGRLAARAVCAERRPAARRTG